MMDDQLIYNRSLIGSLLQRNTVAINQAVATTALLLPCEMVELITKLTDLLF